MWHFIFTLKARLKVNARLKVETYNNNNSRKVETYVGEWFLCVNEWITVTNTYHNYLFILVSSDSFYFWFVYWLLNRAIFVICIFQWMCSVGDGNAIIVRLFYIWFQSLLVFGALVERSAISIDLYDLYFLNWRTQRYVFLIVIIFVFVEFS